MLSEVLRYLGINGKADAETLRLVSECTEKLRATAEPKVISRIFSPEEFLPYMVGEDIKEHLIGAEKIILLAATLGIGVDRQIRKYEAVDMAHAAAFDAAAAAYIEEYLDKMDFAEDGLYPTMRFSPGYGDYPLSVQPMLLKALSAQKIGLSALPSFMLLPTKSVTAVIGLKRTADCPKSKCAVCPNKKCKFRNTEENA